MSKSEKQAQRMKEDLELEHKYTTSGLLVRRRDIDLAIDEAFSDCKEPTDKEVIEKFAKRDYDVLKRLPDGAAYLKVITALIDFEKNG